MSLLLDVSGISCSYRVKDLKIKTNVVHNVSFQVQKGESVCLLGPSGCGKTTVLRAIAGFEPLDCGHISLAGTLLSQREYILPPEQRKLGMVFQDYALFPHLNVADNVRFGLSGNRFQKKMRVHDMLALVGMTAHAKRFPHELSGGQQQRVALARTLAPAPRLLLMDEPFSSLDTGLRQSLSHEIRSLLKQSGTSAILVTHDQGEAFAFADKIGLLDHGHLMQWGTAQELYHQPASLFTGQFIGQGSLIQGTCCSSGLVETAAGSFIPSTPLGSDLLEPDLFLELAQPEQSQLTVLVRPDQITCNLQPPYNATVTKTSFQGNHSLTTLTLLTGEQLLIETGSHFSLPVGSSVRVMPKQEKVSVFSSPNISSPKASLERETGHNALVFKDFHAFVDK